MKIILLIIALLFTPSAVSADSQVGGHLKLRYDNFWNRNNDAAAALGDEQLNLGSLDFRLKGETRVSPFAFSVFDFSVHGEMLGITGDEVAASRALSEFLPALPSELLPNDRRRFLRLTQTVEQGEQSEAEMRLDRLAFGCTTESYVVRVGRQAVTWGNGFVFQVLDLVNPFTPLAIDKDYKTGDDLIYSQALFSNGSDLQVIVVPRRDPATDAVLATESSFAVKYLTGSLLDGLEFGLVGAKHFDDNVIGLTASINYFEAVWRIDFAVDKPPDEPTKFELVANVDRSWELFGKNVYGYLEYYYDGFGGGTASIEDISPVLRDRIARGEAFVIGKNYLAGGGRIELTALLNGYITNIFSLNDHSDIIQMRFDYEIIQNLLLTAGGDLPIGPRGTEFGGLKTPTDDLFLGRPAEVFVKASWYF